MLSSSPSAKGKQKPDQDMHGSWSGFYRSNISQLFFAAD
jgi:hypothetical protein